MRGSLVAAALPVLLGACASHRIYVPNPDMRGVAGNPAVLHDLSVFGRKGATTGHAKDVSRICGKADLASVEVRKNLGESLVSVITLGAVSPARILFYCGKEPIEGQ